MAAIESVYETISRRTKFDSCALGIGLVLFALLTASCGNFKTSQALNASTETGAVAPDSGLPNGDSQVYVPASPTPTPAPTATPQPTPTPATFTPFRVMTYNIKGIPCLRDNAISAISGLFGVKECPLVNDGWTKKNRERIANVIINIQTMKNAGHEPDVILFQEAFTAKNDLFNDDDVESIPLRTGYPYVAWGPHAKIANGWDDYWSLANQDRDKLRGLLSSGLLILSKHPIVSTKMIEYGDVCTIDDCQSNKGILLVKIKHPAGFDVDVVNSHWQAGSANDIIRGTQADIYKSFVESNTSAHALVLAGDFNLRFPNTSHQASVLRDQMGLTHAGMACRSPEMVCEIPGDTDAARVGGNNLDHVYYKTSQGLSTRVTRGWMPPWTFSGGPLSDHLAFIVDFDFLY